MKKAILSALAGVLFLVAIVMVAMAAGMMDQGAGVSVCVRLAAGSATAFTAAAGFAGLAEDDNEQPV